jgi:hypothetical protein
MQVTWCPWDQTCIYRVPELTTWLVQYMTLQNYPGI